jgi:hypothetical protein
MRDHLRYASDPSGVLSRFVADLVARTIAKVALARSTTGSSALPFPAFPGFTEPGVLQRVSDRR